MSQKKKKKGVCASNALQNMEYDIKLYLIRRFLESVITGHCEWKDKPVN